MAQPNAGQPGQSRDMLIKPEQVDALPYLTPDQKQQYKAGFASLWQQIESNPAGSQIHMEAQQKLRSASVKLMQQLAGKSNRPGSQGRPGGQAPGAQSGTTANPQATNQAQSQQPAQAAAATAQTTSQAPAQGQASAPQISAAMRAELAAIKPNIPPGIAAQGTDAVNNYRQRFMQHFQVLLMRREKARGKGAAMMQQMQKLNQSQQQPSPEMTQALADVRREINMAEQEIRTFKLKNDRAGPQGVEMQRQGSAPGQAQADGQQQKQQNNTAAPVQAQQPQQPQQAQQQQQQPTVAQRPHGAPAANTAQQSQAPADVKMNIERQRPTQSPAPQQAGFQQQQNAQPTAASPVHQQAIPNSATQNNAQQVPHTQQNFTQQQGITHPQQPQQRLPQQPNVQQMPQQAQQQTPTSAIAQNTGQAQFPNQQQAQQQQASAQQQQGQPQRPQPLSHQAALSQAAESYSRQNNQVQPQVHAQAQQQQQQHQQQQQIPQNPNAFPPGGAPNSGSATQTPTAYQPMPQQTQQTQSTKFPIGKTIQLDPRGQMPVAAPPSRPTLGNTGMMQQPGMQRQPQFTLEGEGDRVLSKRKLDELVRQVTGGGEEGALTADVEEAVLALADDFVDNVISSACRLAKLRASQTLDIRDIQIVLERNYGIRIPGYALDETRTVRKFQPAPGWQSKMQAIQAGKVMGNKDS